MRSAICDPRYEADRQLRVSEVDGCDADLEIGESEPDRPDLEICATRWGIRFGERRQNACFAGRGIRLCRL